MWTGSVTKLSSGDSLSNTFQLIPNNTGIAPFLQGCKPQASWNGYLCQESYLATLIFESMDEDSKDRSI
jgi:hypothetical protein